MSRIKIPYATYYNRWPEPDEKLNEISLLDHWSEIWKQYHDILDNGKGFQTLQALQVQIEKEIDQAKHEIDQFPKEADTSEYGFLFSKQNAMDRLEFSLNQLKIREHIINSVLTHFTVNGKVKATADFEITKVQTMALDIISSGKPKKRKRLIEYLKMCNHRDKADIVKDFEKRYGLSSSTFYGWLKELENEIGSISRTGK